jgi:hypothetical protein
MRLGAWVGAAIGVWVGLALTIGYWEALLVTVLGAAGFVLGHLAIDARRGPRSASRARPPRRYEREDLADHLAAPADEAPEPDMKPRAG